MRDAPIRISDGRLIPPSAASRECALDDCRCAVWLLLAGDSGGVEQALDLALGMMLVASKLDRLRGESTVDS